MSHTASGHHHHFVIGNANDDHDTDVNGNDHDTDVRGRDHDDRAVVLIWRVFGAWVGHDHDGAFTDHHVCPDHVAEVRTAPRRSRDRCWRVIPQCKYRLLADRTDR